MTKHTYLRSLQLDAGGWWCWGVTEVSSVILTAETSFGLSLPARGTRRREEEEKKVRLIFERKDSAIGAVRAQVAKCPKSQEACQAMVHQKYQEKVGFTGNVGPVWGATPKINIFVNNKATTTQTPFIDIHLICKFKGVTAMQMIFPFPSVKPDKMENPVYICHISHILASLH